MDSSDKKVYESIGSKIIEFRKTANISQEKLASLSGIDRSHIGFIEQGRRRPTVSTIHKIATALNVSLEDIFKGL